MKIRTVCLSLLCSQSSAFLHPPRLTYASSMPPLKGNDLERDIEERSRKNAKVGAGEVAAGALLGGLIGGPFGMSFDF